MKHNILPVDEEVLTYITQYKITHGGDSPTYREIMDGTAASSTSHVQAILAKLVRFGRLQMDGRSMIVPGMVVTMTPQLAELEY